MTPDEAMMDAMDDMGSDPLWKSMKGESADLVAALLAALSAAGFAVVPREPTEAMVSASAGALQAHIDALPDHIRNRYRNFKHGLKVKPEMKVRARWAAMLAAAQTPPADTPASGPQTARLRVKPDF